MSTTLRRRTFGNAGAMAVGFFAEGILQFAFVWLASRELGPADYGYLEYIIGIITFLLAIVNFGLPVVAVREIARQPELLDRVHTAMFRIRGTLAISFYAAGTIAAIIGAGSAQHSTAVFILFLYLLFVPFDLAPVFDAQKVSRWDVPGRVIGRSVSVVLLFLLWGIRGKLLLTDAALCVSLNLAINVAVAWQVARRTGVGPRLLLRGNSEGSNETRRLLRRAAPIMWANVATTVFTFSQPVLVKWYSSDVETGYFGLANRLIFPMLVIRGVMSRLFLPLLSEASGDRASFERRFDGILSAMALFFMPIIALAIPAAELLITPIFGAEYSGSVRPLQILLAYLFITGAGTLFGTALFALGYQKTYTWSLTIACAVNLIVAALLIPRYGAVGGAWAVFAAEILAVLIMIPAFLKVTAVRAAGRVIKIAATSLLAPLVYYGLTCGTGISGIVALAAGVAIIAFGLWAVGELSAVRIRGIADLFRRQH